MIMWNFNVAAGCICGIQIPKTIGEYIYALYIPGRSHDTLCHNNRLNHQSGSSCYVSTKVMKDNDMRAKSVNYLIHFKHTLHNFDK